MTDQQPWLDPDFEDPTPVGDDGWPDPPLDHDAPPSHHMDELDTLIPPVPITAAMASTGAQEAHRSPVARQGGTGRPSAPTALTGEMAVAGVASLATAAVVWGLVAAPLHSLASWAVALMAGVLTFWTFRATQVKGAIAAGGMIAAAFLFWLMPVLALLLAIVAVAWVVAVDLEL